MNRIVIVVQSSLHSGHTCTCAYIICHTQILTRSFNGMNGEQT